MYIYNSYSLYFRSFSYFSNSSGQAGAGKTDGNNRVEENNPFPLSFPTGTGETKDPSLLPSALVPVSGNGEITPASDEGKNQATTLRFEYLRITAEREVGYRNAEFRVRENFGHRVARRRAFRRNMARFLKHLTRKVGKELRRFIHDADLSEEQVSRLRDAFMKFKEEVRDLMHSLHDGGAVDAADIKGALKDIMSSFIEDIEEAFTPQAESETPAGETIPITDSIPINKEPVPVISEAFEGKSQIEAIMVNVSAATNGEENFQQIEEGDGGGKDFTALVEGLKNTLDRVFEKTMKKISKMLDKLTKEPPKRKGADFWSKWSIEIDYISIYKATGTKETPESEPAPAVSSEERPTLYA